MMEQQNPQANLEMLAAYNTGRLVVVGLSPEGEWEIFTGMGGRSEGSRNRYYLQYQDEINEHSDPVVTAVNNPDIEKGNPLTTLYTAHRELRRWHVGSNGKQTNDIAAALATGGTFEAGQELYETEGPNTDYTARITVAANPNWDKAYMGKIVRDRQDLSQSVREVFVIGDVAYPIQPGEAYYTTTYEGDNGTEPNYDGPRKIILVGHLDENVEMLWEAWDARTKAGLTGKHIEADTNRVTYKFKSIHPARE